MREQWLVLRAFGLMVASVFLAQVALDAWMLSAEGLFVLCCTYMVECLCICAIPPARNRIGQWLFNGKSYGYVAGIVCVVGLPSCFCYYAGRVAGKKFESGLPPGIIRDIAIGLLVVVVMWRMEERSRGGRPKDSGGDGR
jgi:hypothetical protein